MLYLS